MYYFPLFLLLTCSMVASLMGHGGHTPPPDEEEDVNDDSIVFNLLEDKEHLKEHEDEFLNLDLDNMSQSEIRFHYFRHHDFDKNRKLDGLELLATLGHSAPANFDVSEVIKNSFGSEADKDAWVVRNWVTKSQRTIDRTMRNHDENNDGYLTYKEYIEALDKKAINL